MRIATPEDKLRERAAYAEAKRKSELRRKREAREQKKAERIQHLIDEGLLIDVSDESDDDYCNMSDNDQCRSIAESMGVVY